MPDRICPKLIKLLRRLRDNNEPVTIIIKAGQDCCEHTGCIGEIVSNCYMTLISGNDGCARTYIPLDCICAITEPGEV